MRPKAFLLKFQLVILVLGCSFLLLPEDSFAQSRKELEEQRMEIINRIEETDNLLKKSKSKQKATMQDYRLIQSQIQDRERLLSTIQNELVFADEELIVIHNQNTVLASEMNTIQHKYYYVLNQMYKRNVSQNKWTFILDAKSINETFKRWRYVKQYEAYIQELHQELRSLGNQLEETKTEVETSKTERELLLESENEQFTLLKEALVEKDRILEELEGQTADLEAELNEQKANREKLNAAIESVIIAALSGDDSSVPVEKTEENKRALLNLSSSFKDNKGKLPWPVQNGRVSSLYGRQEHEALKNIYVQNNGIDITCQVGTTVNSIFDGEIAGVNQIQGFGYVVIIKHGDFYSVYSKLGSVQVERGQVVKSMQAIGKTMTENGSGVLHLEIWEGKQKTNPSVWIQS